ncbi:cellulase family glycosylhydrolase [Mycolicibacter minnesotensis]
MSTISGPASADVAVAVGGFSGILGGAPDTLRSPLTCKAVPKLMPTSLRRIQSALAAAIVAMGTLTGAALAPSGDRVAGAGAGAQPPVIRLETVTLVNAETNAVSTQTFGVADSDLYLLDESDLIARLGQIWDLGVTDLRLGVPWIYIQPTATTHDWVQMDTVINTAHAMGFSITAAITGNPTWGGIPIAGAPDPAAYADFAAAVAHRYGSAIWAYEIWNEPNGAIFYSPVSAASYTAVLQAAYEAIKAVDPDATVLAGALGATTTVAGLSVSPQEFLEQMYASGAQGYFDAVSYHPYHYTLPFSAGLGVTNSPLEQVLALAAIMAANGDDDLSIWATEYGNATTPVFGVDESVQATFLQDFLIGWSKLPFAGPAFIYSTQDLATGMLNHEANFGLFTDDGTAKLAAEVLAALIAAKDNGALPDYTAPLLPDAEVVYLQLAAMAAGVINQALIIPNAIFAAIYQVLPEPLQQAFTAVSDFITAATTEFLEATKPLALDAISVVLDLGF